MDARGLRRSIHLLMNHRRVFSLAVLLVLAAVALGVVGILVWGWASDYRFYRSYAESVALPGEEPTGSLEEFLRFRRALSFADAAERLEEMKATAEVVRATLGEPDHIHVVARNDLVSWFYSGPVFRGRRSETIVMSIDLKTSRVTSLGYIVHD